jgi:hypothetical protein
LPRILESRSQGIAISYKLISSNITYFKHPRKAVISHMRVEEPDGFRLCEPTMKKIKRGVLTSLGPHHEWSGDGHDKLVKLGFPIWGIRDKWSGKWLGLWVVPNNRYKEAVAYLYLSLVTELAG